MIVLALLNFLIGTTIFPNDIQTPVYNYYDLELEAEIQEYITDECLRQFDTIEIGEYKIPLLVMNLIRWESGFNPSNDNGKCCGYMSITYNLSDSIIDAEQIDDLLDPHQNIRAGIHILKNKYDEIIPLNYSDEEIILFMLEAYHSGLDVNEFDIEKEYKYANNILESYNGTEQCTRDELNGKI